MIFNVLYIFITKVCLTSKSQRRVTPFLPPDHQCPPPPFTSCHVYFCLFCFIFNASILVFLLPPPLSRRTHLLFSLLYHIRRVQLRTPGRRAIKKRKIRESFRRSFWLPYVQRNAYSTSQKTLGIQLYQTSRSAIIHPDITPSSFSLCDCLKFIIKLPLSECLTPRCRLLPSTLVSVVPSSRVK